MFVYSAYRIVDFVEGVIGMRLVMFMSAIVLSACSTQEEVVNPTVGTKIGEITVSCPGDWQDCYKQADKLCGSGGYRELGQQQDEPVAMKSAGLIGDDGWDINTGPTDGIVTFRCN